jgi:ribosomal protein L20
MSKPKHRGETTSLKYTTGVSGRAKTKIKIKMQVTKSSTVKYKIHTQKKESNDYLGISKINFSWAWWLMPLNLSYLRG